MTSRYLFSMLAVLSFVLLSLAGRVSAQEVYSPRVFDIARQLRCTQCRAQSVAESDAPISIEFRNRIQMMIDEGQSDEEIFTFFRERYGDWVFMEPPKRGIHLIVWLLPLLIGILALIGLAFYMRRWLRKDELGANDVSDAELARVREALNEP